jgi:hypothetical protein
LRAPDSLEPFGRSNRFRFARATAKFLFTTNRNRCCGSSRRRYPSPSRDHFE